MPPVISVFFHFLQLKPSNVILESKYLNKIFRVKKMRRSIQVSKYFENERIKNSNGNFALELIHDTQRLPQKQCRNDPSSSSVPSINTLFSFFSLTRGERSNGRKVQRAQRNAPGPIEDEPTRTHARAYPRLLNEPAKNV